MEDPLSYGMSYDHENFLQDLSSIFGSSFQKHEVGPIESYPYLELPTDESTEVKEEVNYQDIQLQDQMHEIKIVIPQRRVLFESRAPVSPPRTQVNAKNNNNKTVSSRRQRATARYEPQAEIEPKVEQPKVQSTTDCYRTTKNLLKNYAKAIVIFGSSEAARPYVETILEDVSLDQKDFSAFLSFARDNIIGVDTFRNNLLVVEGDTPTKAAQKRAFQALCVVFIKYFSVNWIIHSRIKEKLTYLKYRFRLMRRIQNPGFFTYLRA